MYLLDTHALLWANIAPELLSSPARHAVESRQIKVSAISLWELITKKNRATAPVRAPLAWWDRYITRAEIEVLAVRVRHVGELDSLPEFHKDPFDRMLIAQARAERLRLVTADRIFADYDVETVW